MLSEDGGDEPNGSPPARRAIDVRELRRRFGRQQVLDGVNLDCPRGHITTIVGPSGCGKTVLLKHLNLLMRPDSGTITIDGVEVTRLAVAPDDVREKFGMLFQAGALFDSMSVFDNVAFPLVEKTGLGREEIAAKCKRRWQRGPAGDGGQVSLRDERWNAKARGARARAHPRPKILMLDEPTTGLDPTRTGSIHALVRQTQQQFGLTVVMVSHDVPAVFEISDRVAFMHEGRMRLTGTPAEVMAAKDEVFNRFLAGRASGDERDATAL